MEEGIGLFEAIYTQRQTAYFKPDPVPHEALDHLVLLPA